MAESKHISLVLRDHQAPGLVDFLYSLPNRYESAFIRGLVYQWVLENQDAKDLAERIEAVVNGPGGRMVVTTAGLLNAQPAPRQRRPRPADAPRRAQTVMPGVAPTPAHAPSPLVQPVAATLATPPVAAPAVMPPAVTPTPPSPALAATSAPVEMPTPSAEDLAALDHLGEMF
ncbi:hypothetical protein [Rubrivivax gelatinosus]|uniref:hypothetical protein n=1 Tax=Rubrivivax gelatinosus TaxID=28068 RepID=UPI0005C22717|nr:hypothetical protein [Rubrivivax gelatinosus]MBG6083184.1 hypothetical protein [Rubrivivax gelatinosus]